MRDIKYIVVGSIIILAVEGVYFLRPKAAQKVLSENTVATSSPSPVPTDSPTPSPSPTPRPTKKPTPKPSPTPIPASSQEINGYIDSFSGQYSLDPNFVRHVALCESGFNPNAVLGPYVGLFQFDSLTWKNIRREMGRDINANLRFSAEESVQTASYALSHGKRYLWPHCTS